MDEPLVFSRANRGCLFYSVVAVSALFLTSLAFVAPPALLVDQQLADEATGNLIGLGSGSLLALGALVFVFRAWRRRRGEAIRVHEDRLERVVRGRPEALSFSEIAAVHLFHDSAKNVSRVLVVGRDARFDLREGEWPAPAIAEALERRALPRLVTKARLALEAGEHLRFDEPASSGPIAGVLALLLFLGGAGVLVAGLHEHRAHLKVTFALFAASAFLFERWFSALGGGITLTRTGVRRSNETAAREVPFGDLRPWKVRPFGLDDDHRRGAVA